MKTNQFGEIVLDEDDLCDLVMKGHDILAMPNATVARNINIEEMARYIETPQDLLTWTFPESSDIAVPEFDHIRQNHWFMPNEYKQMDIAEHVLSLCETQEQLQRCGEELLLFQERDLFDLLRYLRYLVDVMQENRVIWGVGRGSSVASYVLYLLGVHRIDSIYYQLDVKEFLR